MSNSNFFCADEDKKLSDELSLKILKDIEGYTLNQIDTAFKRTKSLLKSSLIIESSSLISLLNENL